MDYALQPPAAGNEGLESELWFLPGPPVDELGPACTGTGAGRGDLASIESWTTAQAHCATRLARVAAQLGGLDERLRRRPAGWRQRLALIEAADLGWQAGDRIGSDRLALWLSLRLSGVQEDMDALGRLAWAVRRLDGGPGPEPDLVAFLGRRGLDGIAGDAEPVVECASAWLERMEDARALHPITRACMGFHLWSLAGLDGPGAHVEAAVAAARVAAGDCRGAAFTPLATGGAGGLRRSGSPAERLLRWLDGMGDACLGAMRQLDDLEAWADRAERQMAALSGRTPAVLRRLLIEWPLLSAAMVATLGSVSATTARRNLAWMEVRGLVREVTGQGRYRMWRVTA